jgi:type IV secretion system protein VirB2
LASQVRSRTIVALGATALIVLAGPALAQSIDLSPVQTLLQGIVDAITGPLGIVIGTLALIGVFLSWLFGILDFRQALWVLVAIAGIAAAPTIVAAIWTTP